MPSRRDVLRWTAGANAFALLAETAGSPPNGVLDEASAKLTRDTFGELRIYFDGPTDQLKSLTAGSLKLKPGMSPHPPHRHPEEEFLVVAEGSGEVTIEGKPSQIMAGSMMYCAGGKLHGIVNTGTGPLVFYFYKWKA